MNDEYLISQTSYNKARNSIMVVCMVLCIYLRHACMQLSLMDRSIDVAWRKTHTYVRVHPAETAIWRHESIRRSGSYRQMMPASGGGGGCVGRRRGGGPVDEEVDGVVPAAAAGGEAPARRRRRERRRLASVVLLLLD